MRQWSLLVLVGCLLLSGCGGKSAVITAHEEMLKIMNELNDVLVTVKDKASADAARPELDALAERMKTFGEQFQKLTGSTPDDTAWMQKEYLPAMKAVLAKLKQSMSNVQDPEIKQKAGEILMGPMNAALRKGQAKQ